MVSEYTVFIEQYIFEYYVSECPRLSLPTLLAMSTPVEVSPVLEVSPCYKCHPYTVVEMRHEGVSINLAVKIDDRRLTDRVTHHPSPTLRPVTSLYSHYSPRRGPRGAGSLAPNSCNPTFYSVSWGGRLMAFHW